MIMYNMGSFALCLKHNRTDDWHLFGNDFNY